MIAGAAPSLSSLEFVPANVRQHRPAGRWGKCPTPGGRYHSRLPAWGKEGGGSACHPSIRKRRRLPEAAQQRGAEERRAGRDTDDRGSDREWATDLRARAPAEVGVQDDRETRARRYRSPRWKRGLRVHGAALRSIHPRADFPVCGPHRRTEGRYPAVVEPRDGLICGSRSRGANKPVMT